MKKILVYTLLLLGLLSNVAANNTIRGWLWTIPYDDDVYKMYTSTSNYLYEQPVGTLKYTSSVDFSSGTITTTEVIASTISASGAEGLSLLDDGDTLGIFIEDGGNVGINTAEPTDALTIAGNGHFLELANNGENDEGIYMFDNQSKLLQYVKLIHSSTSNDFRVEVGTCCPNALYIKSLTGNVGIGTNTPAEKLDVNGIVTSEGIYASVYVNDGSTTTIQSIPTGMTYTKITAFTDDGLSANCTADSTNDKITITKTGIYRVSGSFSFGSASPNITFYGAAFFNNVEQDQIHFVRKIPAGDVGAACFTGFIDVTTTPLDLDFRIRHDNGSSIDIYFEYSNLNIEYIGRT